MAIEGSKTTTVTRIATLRGPITVTVGIFERFGLGREGRSIPLRGGGGFMEGSYRVHVGPGLL